MTYTKIIRPLSLNWTHGQVGIILPIKRIISPFRTISYEKMRWGNSLLGWFDIDPYDDTMLASAQRRSHRSLFTSYRDNVMDGLS